MAQGGKRPGAGRPKGARNKKTEEQVKAVQESGQTPLEFLLSVMRSEVPEELKLDVEAGNVSKEVIGALAGWYDKRIDAAKAAAPYVHPKLTANKHEHTGEDGGPIKTGIDISFVGKDKG